MASVSAIEFGRPAVRRQSLWRYWRGGLQGSEFAWALAFLVPYIGVFLAFVVYPVFYGLRMGSEPSLYRGVLRPDLSADRDQHLDLRYFRSEPQTVLCASAIGLFHAPGLVGQRAADDLRPALGGAGLA